mgnify:CR=1 FL=1
MKSNFATDSYSTAGGLAAVAYNNPDNFREVKDQIIQMSPTGDLDLNMPSTLITGAFDEGDKVDQYIQDGLTQASESSQDFSDWLDVNEHVSIAGLAKDLGSSFLRELDGLSDYRSTLENFLNRAAERYLPPDLASICSVAISSVMRSDPRTGDNVDSVVDIINNNPFTKLSAIPPDTIIPLDISAEMGKDYRGVDVALGYLTPFDYYNNVAFAKNLAGSAAAGYVGYPQTPLESLYNPDSSVSLGNEGATVTYVPQALSELSSESRLSQSDRDLYNLSLMAIDLKGLSTIDLTSGTESYFKISEIAAAQDGTPPPSLLPKQSIN